jgi:hypothetical protein
MISDCLSVARQSGLKPCDLDAQCPSFQRGLAMHQESPRLQRRTFLKSGLLAAAGAGVLNGQTAVAADPAEKKTADKKITDTGAIPTRRFGKTGHMLPILGMGGSAMVQMFIRAYGVPLLSMDERVAMVRYAYDKGVRYFDTARVYGESESIMGKGLKGVREKFYLATKMHFTDPAQVRKSVETSLAQLDMDYLDCVQIHSRRSSASASRGR